ncbi:hypothetical protein ACFLS1_00710 [Verrucomicrobiota bacterium]
MENGKWSMVKKTGDRNQETEIRSQESGGRTQEKGYGGRRNTKYGM